MAFGKYLTNSQIRDIEETAYRDGVKHGFEKAQDEFYKAQQDILLAHRKEDILYLNATFIEALRRYGFGQKRIYNMLMVLNGVEDDINDEKITIADILRTAQSIGVQLIDDTNPDKDIVEAVQEQLDYAMERKEKEREKRRSHKSA